MAPPINIPATACRLCGSATTYLGAKAGRINQRDFHFYRCLHCQFAFVADPWRDYKAVYSEDYYRGLGADPYVNFVFEAEHPATTIRVYEWRGILQCIRSLVPLHANSRWLDFGCGQGGLLQYSNSHVPAHYFGFEEGWIDNQVATTGFTLIRRPDLLSAAGPFDVITAIEVFEHIENPRETLALLRTLLKKDGLLFVTTGNPQPHWRHFLNWEYANPEVHISYFIPALLARLFAETGFRPEFRASLPGYSNILRYKVLKRLRVKEQQLWEKALPWSVITRAIDQRLKLSRQPIAWG